MKKDRYCRSCGNKFVGHYRLCQPCATKLYNRIYLREIQEQNMMDFSDEIIVDIFTRVAHEIVPFSQRNTTCLRITPAQLVKAFHILAATEHKASEAYKPLPGQQDAYQYAAAMTLEQAEQLFQQPAPKRAWLDQREVCPLCLRDKDFEGGSFCGHPFHLPPLPDIDVSDLNQCPMCGHKKAEERVDLRYDPATNELLRAELTDAFNELKRCVAAITGAKNGD